jgi:hypothetical protein
MENELQKHHDILQVKDRYMLETIRAISRNEHKILTSKCS